MTGPKGNGGFCLPETLNIEVEGNKTHCFVTAKESSFPLLRLAQICRVFKKHDLITCESKVHVVFLGS